MESSATDPFTYQPLTEPDSIRLLLIQPATSHTTSIKCKLLHTTLSRCNHEIIDHYTALSYVWGNASHTKTINVDGRSVTVTATLEAAIRDLRDLNRPLHIWADALCIDQSNVNERNQQVRLMGKIYSTAHHTVIHLGALSPGARKLLDATLSNSNPYYGGEESGGVLQNIAGLAEKEIISRPWFNRVWIFQELVLSRDPWVQCGILRARWADFCSLVLSGPRVQGGGSKRIELLRSMNNMRAGRSGGGLLNMLLDRRGLGATDPRDMVFAHMGIAADRNQWGDAVQVDYRKSCAQVYEDVARYLLSTVGPEKLFAQLDSVPVSTRQSGLASWSPDWSLPASYTVAMYKDNLLYTDQLDAKRYSVLAPEEHVLAYMGYVVDEIESVSLSVPPFSQMNAASRTEYQDTVQELKKLYARAGGSYWSGDEDGQHINISLRRHRDEHMGLCQKLLVEWTKILEEELSMPRGQQDYLSELEGHKEFVASFKTWFEGQAMNPGRDKLSSNSFFKSQGSFHYKTRMSEYT
jgi:hypothetical protein